MSMGFGADDLEHYLRAVGARQYCIPLSIAFRIFLVSKQKMVSVGAA